MNKNILFYQNLSEALAFSVLHFQKEEMEKNLPGSSQCKIFAVSGSSGQSRTSERFSRSGTTTNRRETTLPDFLKNIIGDNVTQSTISPALASNQNNFLSGLLTRDNSAVLGKSQLENNLNINPTEFSGKSTLETTANRNPFSTDYENATANKFTDTVRQAMAAVSSGPDSVRGGQNRVGLRQGEALERASLDRTDEIRRAQAQDSQLGQAASSILAAIEAGRRAIISGSQNQIMQQFLGGTEQGVEAAREVDAQRGINSTNTALAGRLLGTDTGTINENLAGLGSQTGSTSSLGWNILGGCCFIFMEALNGELPWYVRRGRDIFVTPSRRVGYVRMSRWLVPLMARREGVKHLVNLILIKPFLKLGAWYFGEEGAKPQWRFYRPYCEAWFALWDFLGRKGE